jgi:hypothetical protein
VQDDYYGLWEVPVEFFTVVSDSEDEAAWDPVRSQVVLWLQDLYECLLRNELIAGYFGSHFQKEHRRLSLEESIAAVQDLTNYNFIDIPEFHFRVWATPKGKDYLRQQKKTYSRSSLSEIRKIWQDRKNSLQS